MDELASYDYDLPPELIATEPLPQRDLSRMLVVDRRTGILQHRQVRDLPEILRPGDRLVLNDTQVVPARIFGLRTATGGKWEGLFLGSLPSGQWRLIGQSGGRLRPGDIITLVPAHGDRLGPQSAERLTLNLIERDADGVWTARPSTDEPAIDVLGRFGTVPLPPYIRRKRGTQLDWQRYQTTYACRPGAVAAPTAGLHFTPELLAACADRRIDQAFVTLHVGIGTFRPISVERLSEHVMHREWCEISEETCRLLMETRQRGGRIVAIGTTSVRTLETSSGNGLFQPWSGETNLFLRPPHEFRGVDCLLTNFHLPRSTLLVLVSALAGFDLIRRAYEAAVRERYRFYSYGDSMLIL
jgi:S-adenosylmethionine:tRNA ribosyltransferase-isomerase